MNGGHRVRRRRPIPPGCIRDADGRLYLNRFHQAWCEATRQALASQPPASQETLIAQTRRLENATYEALVENMP